MPQQLYSVAANGHERLLLSADPVSALKWCVAHDNIIATADVIMVTKRTDLVVVGGGKTADGPRTEKAAKPDRRDDVPGGMRLVRELAAEVGLTPTGMLGRLKARGIAVHRLDVHGRPNAIKAKDAARAVAANDE